MELFGGLVGGSERAATDVLYMALAVVIGAVACALILIIIVILVRFRLCAPAASPSRARRSRAHHSHGTVLYTDCSTTLYCTLFCMFNAPTACPRVICSNQISLRYVKYSLIRNMMHQEVPPN